MRFKTVILLAALMLIAVPTFAQSGPSTPPNTYLGVAFAMAIGLSLELMDKSIRTTQDITRHLDVPILGAIPHADDEEVAIKQIETAANDSPRSLSAEAFRRIRTNLQFSAPADRQRSVLITSAQPEDGTTTVATNLAIALAQSGRKVLLVDANFRRPRLQQLFKSVPATGLSNILIGQGTLAASAVSSGIKNLDVLGAGPTPPNPAELLSGEPCREFLREAIQRYEQVIIDTAPILLASDATVLAAAVDGVILVVRAKRDSRGIARRAHALLTDVRAHVFGVVLNAAQAARGGYFREQHRSFYDYQPEPETPARKS